MPWRDYPSSPAYNTAEYKRARAACLRQAKWRCQWRFPGICTGAATEADHVDGLASDPHHRNLKASCTPCHRKRTAEQGHEARRGTGSADPEPSSRIIWE